MWEKEVTPAEEEKAKVKAAGQMGWKSLGSNPVVGDTPSQKASFIGEMMIFSMGFFQVALVSEENERYTLYTVYICNYA